VNTANYISSGILELYALGALTADESKEVESNLLLYPELQEELDQIYLGLELYAASHAKEPSSELKGKIFSKLTFQENGGEKEIVKSEITEKATETKVMELRPNYLIAVRWLAAACVALLFISGYLFYENSTHQSTIDKLDDLTERVNKGYADFERQLTASENMVEELLKPELHKILLNSKRGKADEIVVVFMNVKTEEVMLYTKQLASLPSNKQYQLWALVNGKPINMGVFDGLNSLQNVKKFPELMQAQAFAITIEQEGGSILPTMEQIVVLGAI